MHQVVTESVTPNTNNNTFSSRLDQGVTKGIIPCKKVDVLQKV
jgi:hypothetical protein